MTALTMAILVATVVVKSALYVACRLAVRGSPPPPGAAMVETYAEDHFNDVASNTAALAAATISARIAGAWWVDPVRAGPETGSHSKRPAALTSQHHEPSFGYVMRRSPLPTILKGKRQTRRIDAHSSL